MARPVPNSTSSGCMRAAETIRAGVATIPELTIAGAPTFLISMLSEVVDIFHVNDYLAQRGWRLNGCQRPPGIHFCITLPQTVPGVAERFIEDLRAAVGYAKHPAQPQAASGAMYGLCGSAGGQAMLNEMLFDFVDATYEP